MRATISCWFLQLCWGNESHPTSPDPGMSPVLLTHFWAPAIHCALVLCAPRLCPWFLSSWCPIPQHFSLSCPATLLLLLPSETQFSRTEASGNASRWDSFGGCPLYLLFSCPSASHTYPAEFIPLCVTLSPSLGAILAHFSQAERWDRCGRVCAL